MLVCIQYVVKPEHGMEVYPPAPALAGSTVRALHYLDRHSVRGEIMEAVVKAYKRNRELGESYLSFSSTLN